MAFASKFAAALALTLASSDAARKVAQPTISIVNGQDADECEWKWQVGLRSSSGSPWCGGMLITPEWVLTAAHCLDGQTSINVVAGKYATSSNSGNEQSRGSSKIVMHPQYDDWNMSKDLGLIKLELPMQMNKCVGTVALPKTDVAAGTTCWITGWGALRSGGGQPSVLQEAQVDVISNTDCWQKYGHTQREIDSSMLCAQGTKSDGQITDSCQGDSGGPLVCDSGGDWAVYGATSWGNGCAGPNFPGVWARVHSELEWINSHLNAPTPAPAPAPPPGTWTVSGTGCTMTGDCIQSNNYPSNYGIGESCIINAMEVDVTVEAFSTEGSDFLTMAGIRYSGSNGPASGTFSGTMSWSSDWSVTQSGWKLCKTSPAPAPPPPAPAPAFEMVRAEVPEGERCEGPPISLNGETWGNLGTGLSQESCKAACLSEERCIFAIFKPRNGACSAFESCDTSFPSNAVFENWQKVPVAP